MLPKGSRYKPYLGLMGVVLLAGAGSSWQAVLDERVPKGFVTCGARTRCYHPHQNAGFWIAVAIGCGILTVLLLLAYLFGLDSGWRRRAMRRERRNRPVQTSGSDTSTVTE